MLASFPQRLGTVGRKSHKSNLFTTLRPQLETIRSDILNLVDSSSPVLTDIARYYFHQPSKQIRPLLVLLISQATNGLGRDWQLKMWESTQDEHDTPFSPAEILTDGNLRYTARYQDLIGNGSCFLQRPHPHNAKSSISPPTLYTPMTILPKQCRLAEIMEITHVASLLHDDVIDASALRRGVSSAPSRFTNKLSVLAGNFLIARASAALARLRDPEVAEIIGRLLPNLVEGEILQMKDVFEVGVSDFIVKLELDGAQRCQNHHNVWNTYMQKTYLKTASLMARAACSAAVLGGCVRGEIWRDIAYAYGRNLGIAFQITDDVLDYESRSTSLGKPNAADLELGLVTAPALYAWEEFPEMGELIRRKFQSPGDVEKARELVYRSSAISRSKNLAQVYAEGAKNVLRELPHSDARDALEVLVVECVVLREH